MKIVDLLKKDYIVEELLSSGKQEVLEELSQRILKHNRTFEPDAMIRTLMDREKLGSTGIGEGIAIPHGRLDGLEEVIVAFGRSLRGIDFDALDGRPVYLFFLLLAPEHAATEHLKVLARISRMLKDQNFRTRLMEAPSGDEIYRIITEKDGQT